MTLSAGIDVGGTNTHGVILKDARLWRRCEIEGNSPEEARECMHVLLRGIPEGEARLVVTGGGARKLSRKRMGMDFSVVGEIDAIGRGGTYLSGKKDVFVVSMGTGTAFVSVKGGKAVHMGGTGVGGGTVLGLSRLMLSTNPGSAEKLAKGYTGAMDTTVRDIVGKGIGKIPANATAANFGRAGKPVKAEIAGSMFRMVAESVGVSSYFAAKSAGQEKSMLICGRVPVNDIVKKRVLYTISMFGGRAKVPRHAEYCAAIGAALHA